MRKIIFFVFLSILSNSINATDQVPDRLLFDGKTLSLATSWGYPSPLETYFYQNDIKYPFPGMSTANYRGHIATWEISDDKFYLKEIDVDDDIYKPDKYDIKSKNGNDSIRGTIFADWFSGVLNCYEGKDSKKSYYFYVQYGEVIDKQIITQKDYKKIKKISEKDTANHDLINKYRILVLNQNYISYYFRLSSKEDSLSFNNQGGYFSGKSGYSPLLEYYSNDHMKWPYNWENIEKNGAPNCKWVIESDSIYLTQIDLFTGTSFFKIDKQNIPLEEIFEGKVKNDKIFADWISGVYMIKHGKEAENGVFPAYKEFTVSEISYLRINDGIVTEKYTVPKDFTKKGIPEDIQPELRKILEELN